MAPDPKVSLARKKGWVTRIQNELTEALDQLQNAGAVVPKKNDLKVLCESLEEKLRSYLLSWEKVSDDLSENEFEDAQNAVATFEISVKNVIARARDEIKTLENSPTTKPSVNDERKVKLPPTTLPSYDGDPCRWMEFWDLYKVAVDERKDMADSQKFVHLKSALRGEALHSLEGIRITEANYKIVIDRLKNRFGRPELVTERLMGKLLDLKPMSEQDVKGSRATVDELTAAVKALEGYDVDHEKYGALLLPVVESKLPSSWRIQWARKKKVANNDASVNFAALLQFLEDEMIIREDAERGKKSKKNTEQPQQSGPNIVGTTSALAALSLKEEREKSVSCTFCGEGHRPFACRKEMAVEDRFQRVRNARACFRCGIQGHRANACRWKKRCSCGRPHISLLCTERHRKSLSHPNEEIRQEPIQQSPRSGVASVGNVPLPIASGRAGFDSTAVTRGKQEILMRTVAIRLDGQPPGFCTRALCDTGCTYTLMHKNMAQITNAKLVGKRRLSIDMVQGRMQGEFDVVEAHAQGLVNGNRLTFHAVVVDNLAGAVARVPAEVYVQVAEFIHRQSSFADVVGDGADEIGILFGEDFYDQIVIGPTVACGQGYRVTDTIFGWMVHGGTPGSTTAITNAYGIAHVYRATSQLEDFWQLDHLGICDSDLKERDVEADVLHSIRRLPDGRYEVGWPWKEGVQGYLSANRESSLKRLASLLKRQTPDEYAAYNSQLMSLVEEGYVEEAPRVPDGRVSYLPHRGVTKNSATTKLRIVHDASAKEGQLLSLNQCLETGPSLLPEMYGVLLRFRLGKVAVVGDLEKAFLRISLRKEDRDVTRFFWQLPSEELVEFRMKTVFFGATSSPFLLQVTLKCHLQNMQEIREDLADVAKKIQRNLYVDDSVNSVDSDEEARTLWKTAQDIFRAGGFNLRQFSSNSQTLCSELGDSVQKEERILGVAWNVITDELIPGTTLQNLSLTSKTKRGLVSFLAKVYDPLGLISPILTHLKWFIQDLWKSGIGWDKDLGSEFEAEIESIFKDFDGVELISIPRWINTFSRGVPQNVTLHVFADASKRTYAANVYVRVVDLDENADVKVNLLTSKNRLISPKGETVPRSELLGALIGSRLAKAALSSCLEEVNISHVFLWTDSTVTLGRILRGGPSKGDVFVTNRVREIVANGGTWRWVPTEDNPADIATRGSSAEKLRNWNLWWHGPSWLRQEESCWPILDASFIEQEETVLGLESIVKTVVEPIKEFVEPSVSNWLVLVGAAQRILRLLKNSCQKPEMAIFREVQRSEFHYELEALMNKDATGMSKSSIKSLCPFLDEFGLMRMGGRLEYSENMTVEEKHPVILRRTGSVQLFVLYVHFQNCHAGPSITLAQLRRMGYWILRGRKAISQVLKSCRVCRRFQAAPFSTIEPPLPRSRVDLVHPFAVTGVDLLGHLFLKEEKKCWIALYTCFQVRAVHLEIVADMSTDAFLRTFHRFCSRRGLPREMWSDHGSNFVSAAKSLNNLVKWSFIAERAPWWGGIWERLVGSVKNLLKRVIGRAVLDWEELETLVTRVECVLNRRPISFVWEGGQVGGIPVPLCPEDFLLFRSQAWHKVSTEFDSLAEGVKQKDLWIADLKARWEQEYLFSVLGNLGRNISRGDTRSPVVGEVVLVLLEGEKRQNWPLGRVVSVHSGKDGVIRAATVQVRKSIFTRPVRKLFPLEVNPVPADVSLSEDCNVKKCLRPLGVIDWVQCDFCFRWYHFVCLNLEPSSVSKDDEFKCERCQDIQ